MSAARDEPGDLRREVASRESLTVTGLPAPWVGEHDACAILASVRKTGEATHGNLKRVLDALAKMGHRSGDVNGEGDGCGVLTDIPRKIWSEVLEEAGKPGWLAEDRRFFVGHLMIPGAHRTRAWEIQDRALKLAEQWGADILLERPGNTQPRALGRLAREQEPVFWQIAGVMSRCSLDAVERSLFDLTLALERETPIHVASLSSHTAVYKVRGSVETLYHYYPELRSPAYLTAITLGHTRYSTNTATTFERVQPFSLLGHNGEINTIAQLRNQAHMLGAQLVTDGSDSQDLDRALATLIERYGLTLLEAMELAFPSVISEIELFPDKQQQAVYRYYRQVWGPFSQGPAAIIARHGDETVFSVDALGLRPLWFGETEKDLFFSSEKGVFQLDSLVCDPKPLSPGEKMCLRLNRRSGVEVLDYAAIRERVAKLAVNRFGSVDAMAARMDAPETPAVTFGEDEAEPATREEITRQFSAFGWTRDDEEWVRSLADTGNEPIGSLGYDGPLAALSPERQNIADYIKEAVAVVTNPAIDREREMEHFSTQAVVGPRPEVTPLPAGATRPGLRFVLEGPILMGSEIPPILPGALGQEVARGAGSYPLETLLAAFAHGVCRLAMATASGESTQDALARLVLEAVEAVRGGATLILLDDAMAFRDGCGWIDPLLALTSVDSALRATQTARTGDASGGDARSQRISLRRYAGIILRSGAIRNLHDLALALGFGADAVAPYLLIESAVNDLARERPLSERAERLADTLKALRAGLEKVASTMGIHELRGYGRIFSGLGLSDPVAAALGIMNYSGSAARGVTWEMLDADTARRTAVATGEADPQIPRPYHMYPKIWKAAGQVASGQTTGAAYEEKVETLGREQPIALRHIIDFVSTDAGPVAPAQVDAGLTGHDLPFVISSMSFGSQGEVAFRAYAEAAYRANILSLNGEGGEIPDMMGKYPHNRGQQIASGRFGVDINLINSSNLIEIKVGQGAKPGEGGHLPGRKVSEKVAEARHATPGVDLISPSNNHDIYSIEDLAQFIEELKTANPKARVAVKAPVVPGIGIIAIGIAKAGADIINLTGYEGGTGAARKHSLRHVGLPAEIGVVKAHRELTQSGLRGRVELWCDGGMRTATDVVKMICLGANRVGFGTLAMVAIGCTICRGCQLDTCHVGIATQIETKEQAEAHGLRRFEPREMDLAVQGLVRFFCTLGDGVREITARLGFARTQDLVGRSDLLTQIGHQEQLDLDDLLLPVAAWQEQTRPRGQVVMGQRPLRRPRNSLTTVISTMVMEAALSGEEVVSFEDDKVSPVDRALGTHLSGALTRYRQGWLWEPGHDGMGGSPETWRTPLKGANGDGHHVEEATLRLYASSVPGNGLGAYSSYPVNITVEGGAQDGVAKGMHGGKIVILRGYNHNGKPVDGSVGKSLAYGAIGGLIIVQGDADSRACIRLSGADVIIGGQIREPLNDSLGYIGARQRQGVPVRVYDGGPRAGAGRSGAVDLRRYDGRQPLSAAATG